MRIVPFFLFLPILVHAGALTVALTSDIAKDFGRAPHHL
jgi:hypothetical protein